MAVFGGIKVGQSVDIKRSDGRVHSAVISQIKADTESVTVEWFENKETKGKEIDFDSLLSINPHLAEENTTGEEVLATVPAPTQQGDGGGRKNEPNSETSRKTMGGVTGAAAKETLKTPGQQNKKARVDDPPNTQNMNRKSYSMQPQNKGLSVANGQQSSSDEQTAPTQAVQSKQSRTGLPNELIPDSLKAKDKTLHEIERLQKNREERRAKHAEMRQQRDLDPGNPNYEFLSMIREYQDTLDYRPLRDTDAIEDHQICVCVRKRPINKKELNRSEVEVVTIPSRDHVIVHEPKTKVDLTKYLENGLFRFDYAFDETATNDMVYRFTAQPLVKTIFEGGFATCFAYGQTGSGKTHTMGGDFNGKTQDCSKGIYAFTARDVFKLLSKKYMKENLVVSCSYFEIYSGKVFDLISGKSKLRILEDGKGQVQIVGLREVEVSKEEDVLKLIKTGNEQRTAGQTSANNNSSRSHAVFQIILRKGGAKKLHGKFSLIDLAGNERGVDTSSSNRQTRMEGAEINKSLLALKECIRALGRRNAHLPFRASKLTLVLRDSFVGENSRTCMISMISPGLNSCEHTINTLRYADRVKELGANYDGKADDDDDYGAPRSPYSQDSDLALLHSHNELELSDDMFDYQMRLESLQLQEDQIIERHHELMDTGTNWHKKSSALLRTTNVVDYDCEDYANRLKELLKERIAEMRGLLEQVESYSVKLNEEAEGAKKIVQKPSKPKGKR